MTAAPEDGPSSSTTGTPARSIWARWTSSRMAPFAHLAVVLFVALVSLVLRRRVPVVLNISGYDGLLFARNAESIVQGDWLGQFSNLTLSKGPGYPLFIAAAHALNVELKVAEQVVYLAAVAAVALAVLVCTGRRWVATVAFTVLALDPSNFGASSADIVRDNVFSSLGLLALASVFLTAWAVVKRRNLALIALGAVVSGVAASLYWLTREEGITLAPPVMVVILGLVAWSWWAHRRGPAASGPPRGRVRHFLPAVVMVAVTGIAMAAPLAAVRYENGTRYGVQLDNDMAEGTFMRAYADWSRVEAGERQYRTPITEAQRQAVYPISEAAQELAPFLEDPANGWRYFGCTTDVCDYGGGWMVWALRDAANSAGYFRDAATAQEFFTTLSDQITAACDDGTLQCASALPASLQPLQRAPLGQLVDHFGTLGVDLLTAQGMYEGPGGAAALPPEMRAEYAAIIDGVPVDDAAAADQTARFAPRIDQYVTLAAVYRILIPVLLISAVIGLGVATVRAVRNRRQVFPLLVLAVALAVGVAIRLFLLALVDTAEYDVALARYQLPGYFMLIAFAVVGTAAWFTPRVAEVAPDPVSEVADGSGPEDRTDGTQMGGHEDPGTSRWGDTVVMQRIQMSDAQPAAGRERHPDPVSAAAPRGRD